MEYQNLIKPFTGSMSEFPSMEQLPEGAKSIALEDNFGYGVDFLPSVVYTYFT